MGSVLSRWLLRVSASDDKDEQALVMVPSDAQLISTDHPPQSNDGRPLESVSLQAPFLSASRMTTTLIIIENRHCLLCMVIP